MESSGKSPDRNPSIRLITVRGRPYEITLHPLADGAYRPECPHLCGGPLLASTPEEALRAAAETLLFLHFVKDEEK